MRHMFYLTLIMTFLAVAVGASQADTVYMADGSQLVGTVLRLTDGKLIIATGFAGELHIDASKITRVAIDQPVNVQLTSGDVLVGPMNVPSGQDKPVVETSVGSIPVPVDQISAIWPVGEESPEVRAVRAEAEKTRKELTPHWSATLEAGGTKTDGNTDTMEARGRFELRRKTLDDLLKFYASAEYSERDDRRDRNEYKGGVFYENNITDRWNWYTRFELEYDEFEDLDIRATVAAGMGYYWLKKADHELATRVGAGYRHESYDLGDAGTRTNDDMILDLGLDYRLDIASWSQFTHSTTYSPSLERFDDYRLALDTALAFPLAATEAWKLKLGVMNEYNSQPQRGLDRLDNTYYANIVLEIK